MKPDTLLVKSLRERLAALDAERQVYAAALAAAEGSTTQNHHAPELQRQEYVLDLIRKAKGISSAEIRQITRDAGAFSITGNYPYQQVSALIRAGKVRKVKGKLYAA